MNPHDCNSHKILSLARLPVPTLPHTNYFVYVLLTTAIIHDYMGKVNIIFLKKYIRNINN